MTMTDPIADLLTRIRNAIASRHETVDIPASKMKLEIIRILKEEGYVSNYVVSDEKKKSIRVYLRYAPGRIPAITTLARVSRPGCRVYAGKSEIPSVLGGIGIIPGAFVGAIIMGQAETLTTGYVSSTLRDAVAFGILIVVLMVRPTGLLGKRAAEKV